MGRFKVWATFCSFTWVLVPVTLPFKERDFLPLPRFVPLFFPSRTLQRNLLCIYKSVLGVFLLTQVCALLSCPDSAAGRAVCGRPWPVFLLVSGQLLRESLAVDVWFPCYSFEQLSHLQIMFVSPVWQGVWPSRSLEVGLMMDQRVGASVVILDTVGALPPAPPQPRV